MHQELRRADAQLPLSPRASRNIACHFSCFLDASDVGRAVGTAVGIFVGVGVGELGLAAFDLNNFVKDTKARLAERSVLALALASALKWYELWNWSRSGRSCKELFW